MRRITLAILVTVAILSCTERAYTMDEGIIARLLNQLIETIKRPEQLSGEAYERYIQRQFDRAANGKLVTIPQNAPNFPLSPGTYYIPRGLGLSAIYNDSNGTAWNLPTDGAFSLKGIVEIQSSGGAPQTLIYYPTQSEYGLPLETTINEGGGQLSLFVPFGGSGSALEQTAASVFVRSLTLNGPVQWQWVAGAGSTLFVAYNASL